jgi:hypothetical protein
MIKQMVCRGLLAAGEERRAEPDLQQREEDGALPGESKTGAGDDVQPGINWQEEQRQQHDRQQQQSPLLQHQMREGGLPPSGMDNLTEAEAMPDIPWQEKQRQQQQQQQQQQLEGNRLRNQQVKSQDQTMQQGPKMFSEGQGKQEEAAMHYPPKVCVCVCVRMLQNI